MLRQNLRSSQLPGRLSGQQQNPSCAGGQPLGQRQAGRSPLQHGPNALRIPAVLLQQPGGVGAAALQKRQQQVLAAHLTVSQPHRLPSGLGHRALRFQMHRYFPNATASFPDFPQENSARSGRIYTARKIKPELQ